jgi:hypothetical protein
MSRSLPIIEPLESRYAPASVLNISIDPASQPEGTGGTKIFTFKVTLSGDAPTSNITVGFYTEDGTATIADNDYTNKSGLLTFTPAPAGGTPDLEQEITVIVTSDNKDEPANEDFRVVLHSAVGATLGNGESTMAATATITDDDDPPKISISSASISEGNIAIGSPGTPQRMTFTVFLSNPSYQPVSVLVKTVDDTASSDGNADFVAKEETITFDPGQTSKTFVVDLNGDIVGELNEKFTVELSNPSPGATLSDNQKVGTGTIINDDPTLRVTDVRVAEGNPAASGSPGTTDMIFTVVLDRAGKNDLVTVDYATADGTATAGEAGAGDYTAQNGTLTFQPGETTKQIIVKVNKDAVMENDETVLLNLSEATNASIDDPQVVGTIANDEIVASLTVNGGTQLRKKEGEFTSQVVFTITLTAAPTDPAGVDVKVLFGGTATKGEDYVIVGNPDLESVHFDQDELTKDFLVTISDDALVSLDETLQVNLSGATNAVVDGAKSQVVVTIENDDDQAFLMISQPTMVTEGPDAKAIVTVTLSKAVESDVIFNFATSVVTGDTATGADFTSVSKSVTIDAGSLVSAPIEVPIVNDALDEKDETFTVTISGGSGGATTVGGTAVPTGKVTILDEDASPTLSFESTEVLKIVEGDSGTKLATFKLKLDKVSGREVTVHAVAGNGTATSGQDYVAFDETIKIAAGQTEVTFSVKLNGDTLDEIDENFFIQLSDPDGATIAAGNEQVEARILNNERQIFINDVVIAEGAGQATFNVRLNAPSLHPVTVTFKTSDGTAIGGDGSGANDDYVSSGEITVTFNPGEVLQTVVVNIVGDTSAEAAETFFGELTNPQNAVISVTKATATINNDDPGFRITDARLVEGGPGATSMMRFTVNREGPETGPVSVDFATENGTAVLDSDYTRTVGTLQFADGQTVKTIDVPILGDSIAEGASETFSVKLSNPSAGVLIDDMGIGTIVDDEAAVVTITNEQIVEGDSGTKQMIFVVTVTGTLSGTVLLDFATVAGTATTADFTNTTGTLNFTSAGSQVIIVPIIGDLVDDDDQKFTVKLTRDSSSATVNFAEDTGVGTIQDDDVIPVISVIGGKIAEGNTGTSLLKFTVKLDRPSDKEVTVDFSTQDAPSHPATAGEDYNALPARKITFLPGQTEVDVFIEVHGDTTLETDEYILGHLANPTNATTGTETPATIQNDELLVSIGDVTVGETSGTGSLTVSLSGGTSTEDITVFFVVNDGTAISTTDKADYVKGDLVFVTIPHGQTSADITFTIKDDERFEGNEKFTVKLTDATHATIGDDSTGTFTITDNEQVTISVENQFVFEGETAVVVGTTTETGKLGTGQTPANKTVQITVKLSNPSDREISVKASTLLAAGVDTAVAGSDFTAFTDDSAKLITFAPGETSKTVSVEIIDDSADEAVETFQIELSNATLGTIDNSTGTIQIVDNDLRGVSISDAMVVEGPAGPGGDRPMIFTVTLSAAATQTVSVRASTLSSTAQAGQDFVAVSNKLIEFEPGQTSKTFTVTVKGDNDVEVEELFAASLSAPSGIIITDGQAQGRIVTDEILYKFDPNPVSVQEGSSGTTTLTFRITREGAPADLPGTVTFTTVDGTAKAGANGDYLARSGVLQFAAGETSETISITVNADTAYEPDETLLLRLTGATNGSLSELQDPDGEGPLPPAYQVVTQIEKTGTIQDRAGSTAPTLSIADVRKSEGNSGITTFDFVVTLSAPNERDVVTVNFNTIDGTAFSTVNPSLQDFVQQSAGTLTFAKGETSKTISVVVNGDSRFEDDETFTVKLSSGDPTLIGDGEATGTIVNDEATPRLTFDGANNGDITVIEGNDGFTTVKLKLKLSGPSEKAIAVTASIVPGGTATQGANADYVAITNLSQAIEFEPGATVKEVEFRILSDSLDELNESFTVQVDATEATKANFIIQDTSATITITDDDPAPTLTINDVSVVEGDSGFSDLIFTVSIDGTSSRLITFDFATVDGTAKAGGLTPDYVMQSGTLTFDGTTTTQTITVKVRNDLYKESNETLQVKLSNADNATIARDTGTGTIEQDDDTTVVLVVKDAKVTEGDTGSKSAVFIVELSAASAVDTVLKAVTRNGTAVSGTDYNEVDRSFTIPAGSTSLSIPVTIKGDGTFEFTEDFFLTIGDDITGDVSVLDREARGFILNDDVQIVDPQTVRYVDGDGDLVTVRITKGVLVAPGATTITADNSILTLENSGSVGGRVLRKIDFTGNPNLYNGTSLFVTAEPQPGFLESGGVSDGKADVGFIFGASVDGLFNFTRGIDFTNIVIDGDLGGMTAGDLFASSAIRGKMSVGSIGVKGTETLPSQTNNVLFFLSKVNALEVAGDVLSTIQTFGGTFGDIGNLTIGGALRGVSEERPGKIIFTGTLGKATIGQIIGGPTASSGSISGSFSLNTSIGSIRVLDGIVGGSGDNSGSISARTINFAEIGADPSSDQAGLIGGSGDQSGSIIAPRIGRVVIGSSSEDAQIEGGSGINSGFVNANSLGSITVFGDIAGGSGKDSAEILVGSLGSANVVGSLIGGVGENSGSIISQSGINSVSIDENLTGGAGKGSANVKAQGSVRTITIGSSSAVDDGNFTGGSGASSALIDINGGVSKVNIHGDFVGGSGAGSAGLEVSGQIGSFTIGGSFRGGDSAGSGLLKSGYITAERIARMTIEGDWKSGTNNGTGVADSGSIRVSRDVGSLKVIGNVIGTSTSHVILAAAGAGANHVAVGNLTIGGNAEYLDVLGGYFTGASLTNPLGNLVNADAIIKSVSIAKDVRGLNVVSGANPGADGRFGTSDDTFGVGSNVINDPRLLATIAKVTINGSVLDTTESYGIVAQLIKNVSAHGVAVALDKLPSSDKDKPIGGSSTFKVLEL